MGLLLVMMVMLLGVVTLKKHSVNRRQNNQSAFVRSSRWFSEQPYENLEEMYRVYPRIDKDDDEELDRHECDWCEADDEWDECDCDECDCDEDEEYDCDECDCGDDDQDDDF